jgi:5-methylcytosine-specific restriction endonuclease McrA
MSSHTAFVLRYPVIEALTRLGILPKIERSKVAKAHDPVEAASPTSKVIAALMTDAQVRADEVQLAASAFRLRNHVLIEAKRKQSDGKCSVCRFDINERFRGIDKDHLVAHRVKPIGQRNRASKTSLDEIDLLCPNCHAAVHSEDPPLSANELRGRLIT